MAGAEGSALTKLARTTLLKGVQLSLPKTQYGQGSMTVPISDSYS